jgi:hypothetical protein
MQTNEDPDDVAGHYRTTGLCILGFGAGGGLLLSALSLTLSGPLGFIEPPAALATCGVMMAVGAFMVTYPPRD